MSRVGKKSDFLLTEKADIAQLNQVRIFGAEVA